jgi:hypothetical protein
MPSLINVHLSWPQKSFQGNVLIWCLEISVSYARILNGPVQVEKIKTYNAVTASIAMIKKERY